MTPWTIILPAANLLLIFWGVLYGSAQLKSSVDNMRDALREVGIAIKDHEKRLTQVETRCVYWQHERQPEIERAKGA